MAHALEGAVLNASRFALAEREGFEPPIRLPVCRISSAVLSTTQPPLREVATGPIMYLASSRFLSKRRRRDKRVAEFALSPAVCPGNPGNAGSHELPQSGTGRAGADRA